MWRVLTDNRRVVSSTVSIDSVGNANGKARQVTDGWVEWMDGQMASCGR